MARRTLSLVSLAAVALPATLLAACGDDPSRKTPAVSSEVAAVDRSSPEVTYAAAHAALAAGDLPALAPYLTDAGLRRLTDDLKAWRLILVDSVTGPRAASRVRLRDDPGAVAAADRALKEGDVGALLRLYVTAAPGVAPSLTTDPPRAHDATRAELEVPARDGERRLVRFVRGADGWRIDHLPL